MPLVIESTDLVQVLAEAEDIARNVSQRLTSAHQLLALFTIPNRAELLLRERGIDEDKILQAMTGKPEEPDGIERDLRERAREVASGVGSEEVDCLHLLIAMSRVRSSAAHQLLAAGGVPLSTLRNVALSYFTSRMPRRLKDLAPQPVRSGLARRSSPLYPPPSHRRSASTYPAVEPAATPIPTAPSTPAPRPLPPPPPPPPRPPPPRLPTRPPPRPRLPPRPLRRAPPPRRRLRRGASRPP